MKKIAGGPLRPFQLTVGLQEGYDTSARIHTMDEVVDIITEHLQKSAAAGKPFLSGVVTLGHVCYAWPKEVGCADGRNEPVAVYSGNISPIYNIGMSDDEAMEYLVLLAEDLATQLNQVRVYVSCCQSIHILQQEELQHPLDC